MGMAASGPLPPAAAKDVSTLEEHRAYLMRYALVRLRDRPLAEDAVQETLLAALQGSAPYEGRAAIKTWLTAILKHKIVDHLRRQTREQALPDRDMDGVGPDADLVELTFAEDGHWREFPADWGAPERSLESKEFWAIFEACVQVMPARAARVFVMREMMELPTDAICRELGISAANCWVMLHRARLALRGCLEMRWFKA
jgi:RNA polymerase sigma-70 factor (ECF subfamily)